LLGYCRSTIQILWHYDWHLHFERIACYVGNETHRCNVLILG